MGATGSSPCSFHGARDQFNESTDRGDEARILVALERKRAQRESLRAAEISGDAVAEGFVQDVSEDAG